MTKWRGPKPWFHPVKFEDIPEGEKETTVIVSDGIVAIVERKRKEKAES